MGTIVFVTGTIRASALEKGETNMRLGLVGGRGWLGSAFSAALLRSGHIVPDNITISGRKASAADAVTPSGIRYTDDNEELVEESDLIVVSIRPEQFPGLRLTVHGKPVVSFMAGVNARTILDNTGAGSVVRAMPNPSIANRRSIIPYWTDQAPDDIHLAKCIALLEACGEVTLVESEAALDYMTVLTGTGNALPALLASILIDDAAVHGIPRTIATAGVRAIFQEGMDLIDSGSDADAIVEKYMEYSGITSQMLRALITLGLRERLTGGFEAGCAAVSKLATSSTRS